MTKDIKERKALLRVRYMSPEAVDNKTDKIIVSILDIVDEAIGRGTFNLRDAEAIRAGLLVMALRKGDNPRVYRKLQAVERQISGIISIIKIREELDIQRQVATHVKELEAQIEALTDATKHVKN